ncbi:uncharacterized protein LOC110030133 [Phalaenopsis equestris]|uniref:uncharacterized protein LOC110030133 n=1 Tax=Phalaenopsis equestris TaxID=78828 RepID=UPI0009E5242E|nr:uncharacterized protein LOC110030133 [Phalaenopsis equestris]
MEMMDEQEEDLGSFSSFDDDDEAEELTKSFTSSSSDFIDDATSSSFSANSEEEENSLFEMSDLIALLPFKRGLSMHFEGKSQSFSSLSNAQTVEDLAKPERPYKKKLKSSKSYGGVLDSSKALSCAKAIAKKPSKGSFSLLGPKKKGFFDSSRIRFLSLSSPGDFSGQALLFA